MKTKNTTLKIWQQVWRKGIVPQFQVEDLQRLKKALEEDDPRLIQGSTTSPPTLQCSQDWPLEACCVVSHLCCSELNNTTVSEAEEQFAKACFEADQKLGEPAAIRYFLNWYDETPREEMRLELLEEINLNLRTQTT